MYASGSSNSSAVGWKTMASGTVLSTLLCCLREFSMAWETREGKRGSVVGTSWGLPVGNLKNRKRGARARYEAGRPENLREKRPKKKTIPNPSRDGVRTRFRNRKPGTRAGQRPRHEKKKSTVRGAAADTAGQRANGGKGFFRFLPFGGRHRWGRCPSAWGPPSFSWAWRPRPALHRPTSSTSRPDLASSPIFACGEDGKTASLLCETPEYEEETFRRVDFPL